ncbi:hypothetical protein PAAG_00445 [Paracoccidioides lutzii Pb01]|uniref:Uncharacterized protein n=1 Tax=Paracoccidioides lutzii (strain ATCC MYA-826 / Pb01) TaxID=502779 RepID=C1GPK0_PARBA|nr:hypothetical protein PAAG_00445 [Paracoccidioides lutzii Pb01]EEH36122.2 hypothetical protein PAAG_00445 [Paracoccidioides lutzii Pb01]
MGPHCACIIEGTVNDLAQEPRQSSHWESKWYTRPQHMPLASPHANHWVASDSKILNQSSIMPPSIRQIINTEDEIINDVHVMSAE